MVDPGRCFRSCRSAAGQRRGFSLLEAVLAAAVLEVAVLAVSYAIVAGQSAAQEADAALGAIESAEEILESVLALPYSDPDGASLLGPETIETSREDFDNADDYDGYTDTVMIGSNSSRSATRTVSMSLGVATLDDLATSLNGLTVTVMIQDSDEETVWTITRFIPESAP